MKQFLLYGFTVLGLVVLWRVVTFEAAVIVGIAMILDTLSEIRGQIVKRGES